MPRQHARVQLTAVPITFLLASEWRPAGRWLVRGVDAVLALTLGCAYFRFTWAMLNFSGAPDAASVTPMVWLYDAQNLVLAAAALGGPPPMTASATCSVPSPRMRWSAWRSASTTTTTWPATRPSASKPR